MMKFFAVLVVCLAGGLAQGQTPNSGYPAVPGSFPSPASVTAAANAAAAAQTTANAAQTAAGTAQSAAVAAQNTANNAATAATVASAVYPITGGVKYNGPQAPPPTVVATPNTNVLNYTSQLNLWPAVSMASVTPGQPDELGTNTATLFIPSTISARHRITWLPGYEPSLTSSTAIAFGGNAKLFGSTQPNIWGCIYQANGTGTTLCSVVNGSTGAVITSAAGVTVSATAVGNGFYQVAFLYTLPAGTMISGTSFSSSSSSTTDGIAGNGTDGMYLSHPFLVASSTVPAYQDVTSAKYYATACYDATGNTSGISRWVAATSFPAVSETNTITPACPTGAVSAKIYRMGGYTSGSLPGAVTIGSAFTDASLVADGTAPPMGNVINTVANPVPDTRLAQKQSTFVQIGGAQYQYAMVLNQGPGTRGTWTGGHGTLNLTNLGFDTHPEDNVFLHILVNGAAFGSSGDTTISLGGLLAIKDGSLPYSTKCTTVANRNTNQLEFTFWCKEIPYTNGIQVLLGTSTLTGPTLVGTFFESFYKVGEYYSSPCHKHWFAVENPLTLFNAYAQVPISNGAISTSGCGEVETVHIFYNSNANYQYLESYLQVACDGILCLLNNGIEDAFCAAYYFGIGSKSPKNDHCGDWVGSALTNKLGAYDALMYRNFSDRDNGDNLTFTSTLNVYTNIGQQGRPAPPSTVNVQTYLSGWN